jgi:hypothetical protein
MGDSTMSASLHSIDAICKKLQTRSGLAKRKHSVDGIFCEAYTFSVTWEVEFTDEFEEWWNSLTEDEQESVDFGVRLLEERGVSLALRVRSSTNGDPPHWGATRPVMIDGTRSTCRGPTICMTSMSRR